MDVAELRSRSGVLSANRNQHALTVVCSDHATAVDLADELDGEISRENHWTVTVREDNE